MKRFISLWIPLFFLSLSVVFFGALVWAQDTTPTQDIDDIFTAFKTVLGSWKAGGIIVGAFTAIYSLIKILRLALIQNLLGKLSPKLVWANWPKWICMVVVALAAFAVAFVGAIVAAQPWTSALIAGIIAAIGSMGADAVVSNITAPSTNANPIP